MKIQDGKLISKIASSLFLAAILLTFAADGFAQRTRIRPPRVEGQTPIGTVNGQPITANDLILMIGSDSPFMPPLDGSPVPVLQQFENNNPANPSTKPDSDDYAEAGRAFFQHSDSKYDENRAGMAFQVVARCHYQADDARFDFLRVDYCELRFRHRFPAPFFRQ